MEDQQRQLEVRKLLDAAAEKLVAKGWIQGRMSDLNGASCAVGAVLWSTTTSSLRLGAITLLAERIRRQYPEFAGRLDKVGGYVSSRDMIMCWNDERGRTLQEVLEVFRARD